MPRDVLRGDLLAAELCQRQTVEMTYSEIGACCNVEERQVRRGVQALLAKGLVEQRRLSAGRVYQYRLLHAEFGSASKEPPTAQKPAEPPKAMPVCAQCHQPRPRLHRCGMCRGCKADLDLAIRVKALRIELGPKATPEEIAERMKQIAEQLGRRRLTQRVRRAMEAVA